MKKTIPPKIKASIGLEAIKENKSPNQLGTRYNVHPIQIGLWKKTIKERVHELFTDKRKNEKKEQDDLTDKLYKIIGQRDLEIDWLKKKLHIDS